MGKPLFMTADERPAVIQDGYRVIWFEDQQLIAFFDADAKKTYRTYPQYDDKFSAPFLRSRVDFLEFAAVLALTHGLKIMKDEDAGLHHPVISFVKP